MAEFDFKCGDCGHEFTLNQGISAPRPKACPRCRKRKKFGQVISIPIGVRGEPTTVGSLAEKNTKRLSKEEYERMTAEGGQGEVSPEMQKTIEKSGGKILQKKRSGEIPWYRNGKISGTERSSKPIDLSKIKSISKYIDTGKKS